MLPAYLPYRCPNCKTMFEIELTKDEEKVAQCPNCPTIITIQEPEVRRLLHKPGLKHHFLKKKRNLFE